VAELADPTQRGRALGWIQSAWAVGWGLANLAFILVYTLAGPALGWRILFWLGILPSLLLLLHPPERPRFAGLHRHRRSPRPP